MPAPIDCRGLACPEPVLKTKTALEAIAEGVVAVLVDNPASRDNVRRFAESQGCSVEISQPAADTWQVQAVKGYHCATATDPVSAPSQSVAGSGLPLAVLITSDAIGADRELGTVLMRAFLNTLTQVDRRPARLLFLNRAIFLTCDDSEALPVLRELAAEGVEIFSCGTCLEFFSRREQLAVGQVSNMYDTVEALTASHRVTTIC